MRQVGITGSGCSLRRFVFGLSARPSPGRDRVLAILYSGSRAQVVIEDESASLGPGTSSRRAGTRALPNLSYLTN